MKKFISVALVIFMALSLSAVVFAEDFKSPTGEKYVITTIVGGGKGGQIIIDKVVVEDGEIVTIKAKPDSGFSFLKWVIEGNYEWISGDLNSPEIVVRAKSNLNVEAMFKGEEGPVKDDKPTSPVTGYNTSSATLFMSVALIMCGAAVLYTGKKYYEAK